MASSSEHTSASGPPPNVTKYLTKSGVCVFCSILRHDDQRADHPGAGSFVDMRMAVEGVGTGLRGLEQRHVALAGWHKHMHVELVDVKVMGRGVGVVEPQRHRLADLRRNLALLEDEIARRKRRERGQRFRTHTWQHATWLDRSRQDATGCERS